MQLCGNGMEIIFLISITCVVEVHPTLITEKVGLRNINGKKSFANKLFADSGFMKCSRVHVVISFVQSCVQSSGE